MIQRKQTLFLLAATALIAFVLFIPFIETENLLFDSFKIEYLNVEQTKTVNAYPIAIYVIITAVLHFFTIFRYKRRPKQMRFTVFCLLLAVGFYGLLAFFHFSVAKEFAFDFKMYNYSLVTPLIAAVFDFMAFKGIQKDELLVRAADRLR